MRRLVPRGPRSTISDCETGCCDSHGKWRPCIRRYLARIILISGVMEQKLTSKTDRFLPGENPRAKRMRMDTASILKRFFFCEQSLIISHAGWLVSVSPFEIKMSPAPIFLDHALTAHPLPTPLLQLHS